MPFEDLTEQQKTFVSSYFKTVKENPSIFKKKRNDKKQEFNESLKAATSKYFEGINELLADIDRFEEKNPSGSAAFMLAFVDAFQKKLEKTLEDGRKTMKKDMVLPDFSALDVDLEKLRKTIANDIDRQTKRIETFYGTDPGRKTRELETALEVVRQRHEVMRTAIDSTESKMTTAPKSSVEARVTAIAAYDKLHTQVNIALVRSRKQVHDDNVSVGAFDKSVQAEVSAFLEESETVRKRIETLATAKGMEKEEIARALEPHAESDVVKLEASRMLKVDGEIARLKELLRKQKEKFDGLETEFAEATGKKEKDRLRGEIRGLRSHIEVLQNKLGQFEKFRTGENARGQRFVETFRRQEYADQLHETLRGQLDDPNAVPKNDGLDRRAADMAERDMLITDPDALDQMIGQMETQVATSAQREILAEKVFPDEPTMMEISEDQRVTLSGLLGLARDMLAEGREDYAAVLHDEARQLWIGFVTQRRIGLPVPDAPPLDKSIALMNRATALEAEAHDKVAERVGPHAQTELDAAIAVQDSIRTVKGKLAKQEDLGKTPYAAIETELDRIESALRIMAHVPNVSDEAKKARKTCDDIADTLKGLYNTVKVDVTEEDLKAGVFYKDKKHRKRGEPIPSSQVLKVPTGKEDPPFEYHRIRTKVVKGVEVNRITGGDIPREIMDTLKLRADTLAMMAETTADGCEAMIEAYQAETQKILDELGDTAKDDYETIEKEFEKWEIFLTSESLTDFLPDGLVQIKAKVDKYKKEYGRVLPSKAKDEALEITKELRKVYKDGHDLKEKYKDAKAQAMRLNFELSAVLSESGLASPDEAGAMMSEMIDGKINRLLAKYDPGDDEKKKQKFEEIKEKVRTNQEWFKTSGTSTANMAGTWRKELDVAFRQLKAKTKTAVDQSVTRFDEIEDKIDGLKKQIESCDTLDGDALLAFVETIADKMEDMATGVQDMEKFKGQFKEKSDKIKADIEQMEKDIKKKSDLGWFARLRGKSTGNDLLDQVNQRTRAAKANYKQIKSTTKEQHTYEAGIQELDSVRSEIDDLNETLGQTHKIEAQDFDAMTVTDKVGPLANGISALENSIAALTEDKIEALAIPDGPETGAKLKDTLPPLIEDVKATLALARPLPSTDALLSTAKQIDTAIKNRKSEKGTKAERVKLREQALAQINALKSEIDAHPCVQIYRDNPFDGGRQLNFLASSFHTVEVAAAACVSPLEKQ